jgi:hypothetical protein
MDMNILVLKLLDRGSDEDISDFRMRVIKPVSALPSCSKRTSRKMWHTKETWRIWEVTLELEYTRTRMFPLSLSLNFFD